MADEREVTLDDMEAAAVRIAERDGITVENVRERLRAVERSEALAQSERSGGVVRERSGTNAVLSGERSCAYPGCHETFVPRSIRHAYHSAAHRAAAYRERSDES